MKISPISYNTVIQKKNNFKSKTSNNLNLFKQNNNTTLMPYPVGNLNINFTAAVTPQKALIETCKSMEYENYNASEENIDKGIFQIDLHSHSNHSDGCATPEEILDQAALYADKLYSKTGKRFTFALTDHDGVSGVKKAMEYIEENKAKFKNINFIPGAELSFAFPSGNEVKSGELLVYFLDPDSKEANMLAQRVRENRGKMFDEFFEALGDGYSFDDLEGYFMHGRKTHPYNLHYRLRNYAQIKTRINKMAKEYGLSSDELYRKMMDGYVYGSKDRIRKSNVTPEGLDEYFKENHIYTHTPVIDKKIEKICHRFYPKIENGKVISKTENSFEYIMEVLKQDDGILVGFAHPYFTAKNMKDYKSEFEELLRIADGKIVFSENYHQAYPRKIMDYDSQSNFKDEVNEFLTSKGLISIGGRDNHTFRFI